MFNLIARFPKLFLMAFVILTAFFAAQLSSLTWETDARVYMPKGHSAIKYDEEIERVFGAKDTLVVVVKNEDKGVLNSATLQTIHDITEKISNIDGVQALRDLDVASLSTATVFEGDDESIGATKVMPFVPLDDEDIAALKANIDKHADILVGNLISADGTAAMIRAKVKEGADNRYKAYWQMKVILAAYQGSEAWGAWGSGDWEGNEWNQPTTDATAETQADQPSSNEWGAQSWGGQDWGSEDGESADVAQEDNGDSFYIAGRPVIEVTSGLNALEDIKLMIPMLIAVIAIMLFLLFKTGRGVMLPLIVMLSAIVWTMGTMALLGVPLYTISTMLPVILVAIGIGDAIHFLSAYYDKVLQDPHRNPKEIVLSVVGSLQKPLVTTSVTTAIGFLALLFAEMPPFKVFGLFTVLGIFYSWIITLIVMIAFLSLMKPKVSGYLEKKRSLRVASEQDAVSKLLVGLGDMVNRSSKAFAIGLLAFLGVAGFGAAYLTVNSSWMSDFRDSSDIVQSTNVINQDFDGSITLNIVVEGGVKGALKDITVLKKIEALQVYSETLPYVGGTISIIDYLKSLNKTLHSMDDAYDRLPNTNAEIFEALYLYSISGQPELLDEMIDFDYQRANLVVMIKTDETLYLKSIIDSLDLKAQELFADTNIDVNFAGQGNNSYVWAELLIDSQSAALVFSKLAIFVIAILLLRSIKFGAAIVVPVVCTTLLVAGFAGWFNVYLDVSTALAAGIAIGVGVDYAVHYVFRYRQFRGDGLGHEEAVSSTMRTVGRTIVFNALVVSCGFAVLLLSQFPPHVKLGAFVVIYMVLSCLMALLLLPLVLKQNSRAST